MPQSSLSRGLCSLWDSLSLGFVRRRCGPLCLCRCFIVGVVNRRGTIHSTTPIHTLLQAYDLQLPFNSLSIPNDYCHPARHTTKSVFRDKVRTWIYCITLCSWKTVAMYCYSLVMHVHIHMLLRYRSHGLLFRPKGLWRVTPVGKVIHTLISSCVRLLWIAHCTCLWAENYIYS